MDLKTAIEAVDAFLLDSIGHTGPSGFEGLVALLLQSATGQEFRLSSSGRQSGRDASSESGFANNIKIEAKHYRETTPLKLRELIAEVSEAANSDPMLDIWILAASRSVDEQIATALDQHAETYGVEIILLDLGMSGLPRLALLVAAFANVVIDWARGHGAKYDEPALRSAMEVIAKAPDFAQAKDRLLIKLRGSAAYDAARRHTHSRLFEALSDERNARGAFRQSLSIRAPDAQVVRRSELNATLDQWWDSPGLLKPAVLLGEEGTGKTWAAFDWVAGRISLEGMPVVLPFAAVSEDISQPDPIEALVPRLLAKWTGVLNEARWKRRLSRWLIGNTARRPLILLLVDGINEHASVEWRSFFSVLLANPWREHIAVLVTDRPYHWRTKCSLAGIVSFCEITARGYTDDELDQALSLTSISHREIPGELLPLMSKPRYCRLVADHYGEIIEAADFTRERLIYLEIKDRRAAKLQYPLTDEQLFEIVRSLAQRALANPDLNPNDLNSLIALPGGDTANIYSEIVSGGILIPVPGNGMTARFKVEPLRLIFGFGMLLADELSARSWQNSSEIEDFLTSWFEPQRDMDRKVEICGSAMFHALFQGGFPEAVLRELIRYWLGLRNWADDAQSAFVNYVLRCPEVFVEVAEEFWSTGRDSGAAQEFLRSAFCTHRDNAKVQPILARAIARWMGFIHPLGRRFGFYDPAWNEQIRRSFEARGEKVLLPNDESERQRVKAGIELRAGCAIVPGDIEVAGVRLTVVSDGQLLRLARFGLMILSAGDRLPFVSALVHWAVASSIMDDSGFHDLVAWVVRLSDEALEPALLTEAHRLLARNEPTASAAARILLLTIGTCESFSLIDRYNLRSDWYKKRLDDHGRDPCLSPYKWSQNEYLACLGREDVPLFRILDDATLPIIDPSVTVPTSLVQRAKCALDSINPATLHAGRSRTPRDAYFEKLARFLSARGPSVLADFMRVMVQTIRYRDLMGQYCLSMNLPEMSLLLRTEEVKAVTEAIAGLSLHASEWSSSDKDASLNLSKTAEGRAFSAVAPHLGASQFLRMFIERPKLGWDFTSLERGSLR